MDFIEELLEATDMVETPKAFIKWAGIASISAVLKRNVWIEKQADMFTFPNMYIFIIAKGGLRKSYATSLARKLVRASKTTKIVADRASIQKIKDDLANVFTYSTGEIIADATGFAAYDELNASIMFDNDTQTILTTMWDTNYRDDYDVATKKDDKRSLKNYYLTMFAASNEEHLSDFLDSKSIAGGFVGRVMFSRADKKSRINSLIGMSKEEDKKVKKFDKSPFINFLKEASKLKGELELTESYRKAYNAWYNPFQEDIGLKNDDVTGTLERIHEQIFKVSICLSISKNFCMVMDDNIFNEAHDMCFECAGNVRRITAGKGKSEFSEKSKKVVEELLDAKEYQMPRAKLLARNWGHFDAIDLDRVIESFTQFNGIHIIRTSQGEIYRLDDKIVQHFNAVLRNEEKKRKRN